jgi:hypothetical protein
MHKLSNYWEAPIQAEPGYGGIKNNNFKQINYKDKEAVSKVRFNFFISAGEISDKHLF